MTDTNQRIKYTWSSSGARRSTERAIHKKSSNDISDNNHNETIFKINIKAEEKKPWSKISKGVRIRKIREFFSSKPSFFTSKNIHLNPSNDDEWYFKLQDFLET